MVIVGPAVGIGFFFMVLVAFGIGYVSTAAVLGRIRKSDDRAYRLNRDALRQARGANGLSETAIQRIAVAVGIVTTVLAILVLLNLPLVDAWLILTLAGIVAGVVSFWANSKDHGAPSRPNKGTSERDIPPGRSGPSSTGPTGPKKAALYQALLAKVHYDWSVADKLISDERKRMPHANLDDLCRSAIALLEKNKQRGTKG